MGYKARLIAKGYSQIEGLDFTHVFPHITKLVTICTILSGVAAKGWKTYQLHVSNTFLHGDLQDEVYMKLPLGFSQKGEIRVCHLRKSLYGHMQASRTWFSTFSIALLEVNLTQSKANYSMFTCHRGSRLTVLLVYVIDIVITGDDDLIANLLKSFMARYFHIKDLGPLKYFLVIEVSQFSNSIFLNQQKYALDILSDTVLLGSKPSSTPMDANHQLSSVMDGPLQDPSTYRHLVVICYT